MVGSTVVICVFVVGVCPHGLEMKSIDQFGHRYEHWIRRTFGRFTMPGVSKECLLEGF